MPASVYTGGYIFVYFDYFYPASQLTVQRFVRRRTRGSLETD